MTEKFSPSAGNTPEKLPTTNKVAALNDQLRKTFQGGQVMMTRGVQSLGEDTVYKILDAVRSADQFDADNDPYGEHDFGGLGYACKQYAETECRIPF